VIDDKPTQVLWIDSLEKVLMPKTHRGSAIGDMFVVDKMIVLTFLDFPDPDKAHRSLAIGDFLFLLFNRRTR
jgi:hypothetical protein